MVVVLDRSRGLEGRRGPLLEGVPVVAVASGKGGVGKSTVALHLALALREKGLAVGLLDADVYGPSIPVLTGTHARLSASASGGIVPHNKNGLRFVSMGFFLREEEKAGGSALIWRGPMAQKAMVQLMRDTEWGSMDILVVDMPPGTGDVQITLAQQVNLPRAVVVSTTQRVAFEDAKKSIMAFEALGVPILGVILNMSQLFPWASEAESWIEGHGCSLLGRIPFDEGLARACDDGEPVQEGTLGVRKLFLEVADTLIRRGELVKGR